ncbi:MAG TPA: carbamoyltransferase HypF, partial [Polyangiales bacterium]|nr:carbamoyltransferase HypF [Polyangiales bacterium]
MSRVRCTVDVEGPAQGVGFRPFVHRLAARYELTGSVCNELGRVHIEVEGEEARLASFIAALHSESPVLAKSLSFNVEVNTALHVERDVFRIAASRRSELHGTTVIVPADLATCEACLRELNDVNDRRFSHAFINCTQCGPRASIVLDMPYDRARTAMAPFALCERCQHEYESPDDRRFHAEPVACPSCGPQLRVLDRAGAVQSEVDPVARVTAALCAGDIVALKGIGGFHLICDATNERAVVTLRQRKGRARKPFALMARDLVAATALCTLDDAARAALQSPARPIVLAARRHDARIASQVAPDVATLGVMLPYAPIHHLLFRTLPCDALVVTSGNRSDEPIACDDAEALKQLGGIADLFLTHDREIRLRMEDSVVRSTARGVASVRRSRGYAPLPLRSAFEIATPTLALGGHQKAVFALGHGRSVVLGPHFGDLGDYAAGVAFRGALAHLERVLRFAPQQIVHDLHPDYATTRLALERAAESGVQETVAVQHHHAHLASAMAEHGLSGEVIGVCFDGSGLGDDGTLWGGEFLVGGYAQSTRAAHLRSVALPGGDRAAREPYRVALAYLRECSRSAREAGLEGLVDARALTQVQQLLAVPALCARTSSAGRLFDAVASLAGVVQVASYEAETGMRLEALAATCAPCGSYPFEIAGADTTAQPRVVDTRRLV